MLGNGLKAPSERLCLLLQKVISLKCLWNVYEHLMDVLKVLTIDYCWSKYIT